MLGNRFSEYDSPEELIDHTTELIIRLRIIALTFALTILGILFIPISWLVLDFNAEYRPIILDALDFILTWSTSDINDTNFQISVGSPLAIISQLFILAILIAFVIDWPFIVYQMYLFASPGLYPYEQNIIRKLTYAATGLFLLGAFFGFQLMPVVTKTLVGLADLLEFEKLVQIYNLGDVIEFLLWNVIATGLVFTYPILIIGLVFSGMLSVEDLQKRRRHVMAALFGITAIITPDPTPISMIVLTIPLLFLYELTINFSYKIEHSPDFTQFRNRVKKQVEVSQKNLLEYGN